MYLIYGAPFEVAFASILLYKLMVWAAFSGLAVFLIGAPLNAVITRRSIRIQKGSLAARDKRMDLLNELLGARSNQGHQVLRVGDPVPQADCGVPVERDSVRTLLRSVFW